MAIINFDSLIRNNVQALIPQSSSITGLIGDKLNYILDSKQVQLFADGGEVLSTAAIMTCGVQETAQLAEHPLEDGAKIVDHKVFQPRQLSVTIAFSEDNYSAEYETLKGLYEDCTFVSMKTKAGVYDNLQIVGIPHDEVPSRMCRMVFTIQLKEAMVVSASYAGAIMSALGGSNNSTTKFGKKEKAETSMWEDLKGAVSSWF